MGVQYIGHSDISPLHPLLFANCLRQNQHIWIHLYCTFSCFYFLNKIDIECLSSTTYTRFHWELYFRGILSSTAASIWSSLYIVYRNIYIKDKQTSHVQASLCSMVTYASSWNVRTNDNWFTVLATFGDVFLNLWKTLEEGKQLPFSSQSMLVIDLHVNQFL